MFSKIKKEEKRQIVHISLGLIVIFLLEIGFIGYVGEMVPFDLLNPIARVFFVVSLFGFFLSVSSKYYRIPIIDFFLRKLERKRVREKVPGKGTLLASIGIFIPSIFFNKDIVIGSIFVLAIGDSVSNIVGREYGKTKIPYNKTKSLEGTLIGFLSSTVFVSLYFPLYLAISASATGMLIESLNQKIDDNLFIPIASAIVLYLL